MIDPRMSIFNSGPKESKTEKFTEPLRGFFGGRHVTADGSSKKIYSRAKRIGVGILLTIGIPYTLFAGGILVGKAIKRQISKEKLNISDPTPPEKTIKDKKSTKGSEPKDPTFHESSNSASDSTETQESSENVSTESAGSSEDSREALKKSLNRLSALYSKDQLNDIAEALLASARKSSYESSENEYSSGSVSTESDGLFEDSESYKKFLDELPTSDPGMQVKIAKAILALDSEEETE